MFALVDCNSFFASCERVFRPDLKNTPVIVLSNNDGCVIARTEEAKLLKIPMCAPYFKIKQVCKNNNVKVFSSNFSLYSNFSDRVMKTLNTFTPRLEVYSVDEAFLDLTGMEHLGWHVLGEQIKKTVEKNIGIPVSVGIAPTKTMAKIANHIAKKHKNYDGVCELVKQEDQDFALSLMDVEDIWGVGKSYALKLKRLGISSAKEFRDYKNEKMIKKLFTKVGLQKKMELKGICCFSLNTNIIKKKEIMVSRSFGANVYSKDVLKSSIANYITSAAHKLRKQKSICTVLEVFIRTNPHDDLPQYYVLDNLKFYSGTSDTLKLIKSSHKLVDKMFKLGHGYKKAGVRLKGLYDQEERQIDFFSKKCEQDNDEIMKVIDKINLKEGKEIIKSLACGVNNIAYKMRQDYRSPCYLTAWKDIPKAYCK